jgi:hypothetical protein
MTFVSTNVKHASLVRMDTGFPIHKNDGHRPGNCIIIPLSSFKIIINNFILFIKHTEYIYVLCSSHASLKITRGSKHLP